ncbi:eCIS core domain-containing protein [Pedobacter sp. PACM 27299]|uniref:eCIS core domain-containing protein n=1 Tax=Pedobacter sp. PACM 27299 TaxID=1727164 RepID=UPI0009EB6D99|nr:DUF4157 domain-containing protein [Pedobacter sp. PACM 27299]
MKIQELKTSKAISHTAASNLIPAQHEKAIFQFEDKREEAVVQRKLQDVASAFKQQSVAQKSNRTGLPDQLKSGIENLSGLSMDDVNVHYNSSKPAQLQAHAYAQGTEIHLAAGQEKHLPHEAWHVVQQKQGRVKATVQMKGIGVNNDKTLEHEADVMGAKAIQSSLKKGLTGWSPGNRSEVRQNKCAACTVKKVSPQRRSNHKVLQRMPCEGGRSYYRKTPEVLANHINAQSKHAMPVTEEEAHLLCCSFCKAQMEGFTPMAEDVLRWSPRAEELGHKNKADRNNETLFFEECFWLASDTSYFEHIGLSNQGGIFFINQDFMTKVSKQLEVPNIAYPVLPNRLTYNRAQFVASAVYNAIKKPGSDVKANQLGGQLKIPDVIKCADGKVQVYDVKFDYKGSNDVLKNAQANAYNKISIGLKGSKASAQAKDLPLITQETCDCDPTYAYERQMEINKGIARHAHHPATVAAAAASTSSLSDRLDELGKPR